MNLVTAGEGREPHREPPRLSETGESVYTELRCALALAETLDLAVVEFHIIRREPGPEPSELYASWTYPQEKAPVDQGGTAGDQTA